MCLLSARCPEPATAAADDHLCGAAEERGTPARDCAKVVPAVGAPAIEKPRPLSWDDECATPPRQTVTIFDWDDTLLPTSYLHVHEDWPHRIEELDLQDKVPVAAIVALKGIQNAAKRLLESSVGHGQTYIITNALDGWVQFTAKRYMPELLPVLEKVHIISARERFEEKGPADPEMWKEMAFLEVCQELDDDKATNLISVGDSQYEINAAYALGRAVGWRPEAERALAEADAAQTPTSTSAPSTPSSRLSSQTTAVSEDEHNGGAVAAMRLGKASLVKTVKFQERPTAEELRKQLDVVAAKFEQIVNGQKDLQIGLAKRWVPPT